MKLKKMLAGHLIVLGLIFPHAVSAEQFTFNVGVNFSNIHEDVDQVRIECRVQTSPTGAIIGSSTKDIEAPASGNLNTTVKLEFNVVPSVSPQDAKVYRCFLFVVLKGIAVSIVPAINANCNISSNDRVCAKPGTTFSGSTFSGPIP